MSVHGPPVPCTLAVVMCITRASVDTAVSCKWVKFHFWVNYAFKAGTHRGGSDYLSAHWDAVRGATRQLVGQSLVR